LSVVVNISCGDKEYESNYLRRKAEELRLLIALLYISRPAAGCVSKRAYA